MPNINPANQKALSTNINVTVLTNRVKLNFFALTIVILKLLELSAHQQQQRFLYSYYQALRYMPAHAN